MGSMYSPRPPQDTMTPYSPRHRCDTPNPDRHIPGTVWGCPICGKTWVAFAHSDLAASVADDASNFWSRERPWERFTRRRREKRER
jgi:hypothetical protein